MFIKYNDVNKVLTACKYNEENHIFEFFSGDNEKTAEYTPVLTMDTEYNPQDFDLEILYNKREDCTENSIYQVYIKEQRIGWLFPVQALISGEHDYAQDVYFLKYAYVAVSLLFNRIYEDDKADFSEELYLDDFYDSSDNVLVLDRPNCRKIEDFNLDDYVVSLYKHGYSFSGKGNMYSQIDKKGKTIRLRAQSKELSNIPYICELFKSQIPKDREVFAAFYTYYQIIEILISIIFEIKFKGILADLNHDPDKLFDKRDDLNDIVSEKNRVRWLFSNYVSIETQTVNMLNADCIELLAVCGRKTSVKVADNLYQARCLLVHKLYILTDEAKEILRRLNHSFLDALMDIILSFHTDR